MAGPSDSDRFQTSDHDEIGGIEIKDTQAQSQSGKLE